MAGHREMIMRIMLMLRFVCYLTLAICISVVLSESLMA
jgi:hypothetical protein